jgi:hypothetical protein
MVAEMVVLPTVMEMDRPAATHLMAVILTRVVAMQQAVCVLTHLEDSIEESKPIT